MRVRGERGIHTETVYLFKMVTHPRTNLAQRTAASLMIGHNVLTTRSRPSPKAKKTSAVSDINTTPVS